VLLERQLDVQPTMASARRKAPRLAASITPGPPPLITAKRRRKACGRLRKRLLVNGESSFSRALPNIDTAGRISDSRSADSTKTPR